VSTVASPASLSQELATICGVEHLQEDPLALENFTIDEVAPRIAVSPGKSEEVTAMLALASVRDLCVVSAGGFTAQQTGGIPERIDVLLRTHRLDQVLHYDSGDLTVGVGAGCTLAKLQSVLAERGQFLPVDPPLAESATIGGLLATATDGPLRHGYGGLRDFCIGIEFVTGDGRLAKAGGRVVKNVTGYDLMKLLIGSQGTLGVITSANFKVSPLPRQTRTFVTKFAKFAEAVAFRDRISNSPLTPLCLEIISPGALEYLEPHRAPRNPDDYHPAQALTRDAAAWRLVLRAAGSDAVLARYRRELGSAVSEELGATGEMDFWQRATNLMPAIKSRHRNAMILQMNVVQSDAQSSMAAAERAALDNNFIPVIAGRAGLGLFTVGFIPLSVDPPSAMQYALAVSALRSALPDDCSLVVASCPTEAKRHFCVWGSSVTDFSSMLAVKRALDPKGILNRGRYFVEGEPA
jgi:glycolate oxidase FAD binding subunit